MVILGFGFAPYGRVTFSSRGKSNQKRLPRHPALPAAGYVHAIIAPGARREGPSLAPSGSRGIHASQPLPQRFRSPPRRGVWRGVTEWDSRAKAKRSNAKTGAAKLVLMDISQARDQGQSEGRVEVLRRGRAAWMRREA